MININRKTRLTRLEERKSLNQAVLFIFLTIVLVIVLLVVGIPALIKLVVFLGDIRSSTQKVETLTDIIAPSVPIIQPPGEATNSAKINLSGYAEPNTNIKIYLEEESVREIVSSAEGNFTIENLHLKEGNNTIRAKAFNKSGESPFSEAISIIYDNKPPEIDITIPQEGDKFFDKDKQTKVEGKTDANINVYVNGRLSLSDNDGIFTALVNLSEGENTITVKAIDIAGNMASEEIKVSYNP